MIYGECINGWTERHSGVTKRSSGYAAMTSTKTSATAAALTATLGLATICWCISIPLMSGMEMGAQTQLGSFESFILMWVLMMAAMMLPGMAPTVFRYALSSGRLDSVLLFVGSYLMVWTSIGVLVFTFYQPHGTLLAGAITIAAGLYEFTPLKQLCRRRCCEAIHSGFEYGLYCVGSCIGLMLMQVALGVMSIRWMAVLTVLIMAQKLLPSRTIIDVPLALMIVGLGMLILIAPSLVPGLTVPM
ncbi:MAG: DUF2182 domain-containing protein [Balneolaceae bacterium]|nr:DUF2182 domain-containing protein [Balneolaceae bacterium]